MTKILLVCLAVLILGAASAFAADAAGNAAGAAELSLLEKILTGNFGLAVGLAVAAVGIFKVMNQNTAGGVTMIILGVLLTLLPGIYNGVYTIVCPIVSQLTSSAVNKTNC